MKLVAYGWDSTHGDYEKRQLLPLPRIGRSYAMEKRQGLIPSPRVGRSSATYNGIETDCSLNPELCNELMARVLHAVHEEVPPVLRIASLAAMRPKKSFTEDYSDMNADDFELTKTLRSNPWDFDVNPYFFERNARQLIPAPRVGRSVASTNTHTNQMQLLSGYNSADDDDVVDPIDLQLRAAFIPRLGKRTTHKTSYDQYSDSADDMFKRAAAFTPRIGRAAFTPRIGKKASFTPRIGRSAGTAGADKPF
ncbi:unnamed protein product [Medioppia subpectinata]|uniref:Uncharacterized protein n=1 Tax=Medioppia subpectinata TaxID=1979941 RepID=A0A7R9Q780_9ACAR|nr:unnamed protein product [Medioppia subpectinata]CAD7634855.1 unnamed protein product [Medioppia subpectinata]CAG2108013.1 unnamed protein product [Medioppia subpectinata]CAG2115285.1 unnamed protein product [Medioppia subpectinata]